jgi:ATP-binding cassette subfamily G (WHITE) protein 2 (SNQ2)
LFLEKRDIYEIREKKAKMYSWVAFVTAMIVAEIPYLIICAVLYFVTFYFTVGFPSQADRAGPFFLVMLMYEFIYTGIGQFVAAYAPNAVAATLINPLVIFTLVGFCGVVVPYAQMQDFWKHWLYYINPFNYLTGSLLVFSTYDVQIKCDESEFAVFDPVGNQTCGEYLDSYLKGTGQGANLINPEALSGCKVCQYTIGQDYLRTVNLPELYYGWRDLGIVALYVFSGYACVYLLMKLRTKKTKKAEGN